ncbi:MAG: chemotaxis protein CheC [Candidatus Sericytochromatia bacterium]|nr:chemotaxis protein CheC [Candidatus Tanganyikabacteria bacterium]
MELTNLSEIQLDALREVGNIGAGNAATALSKLINRRISMSVPKASIIPLGAVHRLVGPETPVWAIYLQMEGDLNGHLLFLLPEDRALVMVDLLMGREPGTTAQIDELAESALGEVGNILTSNYLIAMGNFVKLDLHPSPPLTANDMAGAVVDTVIAQLAAKSDAVLALETELSVTEANGLVGYLFMFPTPDELPKILGALGLS